MKTISIMSMLSVGLLLVLPLNGQTLNTLYSFGHNELGYQPYAIVLGSKGQIFGTSPNGGAYGYGVVFELVPPSAQGGAWSYTVIHSFNGQNGETWPPTGNSLTMGPNGVLYGVAGTSTGDVYRLLPPSGDSTQWHESVLFAFPSDASTGGAPDGALSIGPSGTLYGVTKGGGPYFGGTAFRLSPPAAQGGAWTEQVLHDFDVFTGDGGAPRGPLASGSNGVIYGATWDGGAAGIAGTVFQLTPPIAPGGTWGETVLHSFLTSPADSAYPNGVILGPGGVLYGTAAGVSQLEGASASGTVFQLGPPSEPGGAWTETILHSFTGEPFASNNSDGSVPDCPPILGPNGELYGTTYAGGLHGSGTIYELVPPSSPGGQWTEVTLYNFNAGADGGQPNSVVLGPDGNLYGTTEYGGVSAGGITNQGTIFQLVLPQNSARR